MPAVIPPRSHARAASIYDDQSSDDDGQFLRGLQGQQVGQNNCAEFLVQTVGRALESPGELNCNSLGDKRVFVGVSLMCILLFLLCCFIDYCLGYSIAWCLFDR